MYMILYIVDQPVNVVYMQRSIGDFYFRAATNYHHYSRRDSM